MANPGPSSTPKIQISGWCKLVNSFSGDEKTRVEVFLAEMERAKRLAQWDDIVAISVAQSKLRDAAASFYQESSELQGITDWDTFAALLKERFKPVESFQILSARFIQVAQQPGESVVAYATRLKARAKDLYGDDPSTRERAIMTARFLEGLAPKLKRILYSREPSTLEEAIKIAEKEEHYEALMKIKGNEEAQEGLALVEIGTVELQNEQTPLLNPEVVNVKGRQKNLEKGKEGEMSVDGLLKRIVELEKKLKANSTGGKKKKVQKNLENKVNEAVEGVDEAEGPPCGSHCYVQQGMGYTNPGYVQYVEAVPQGQVGGHYIHKTVWGGNYPGRYVSPHTNHYPQAMNRAPQQFHQPQTFNPPQQFQHSQPVFNPMFSGSSYMPRGQMGYVRKPLQCYYCREIGHRIIDCQKRKDEEAKKELEDKKEQLN